MKNAEYHNTPWIKDIKGDYYSHKIRKYVLYYVFTSDVIKTIANYLDKLKRDPGYTEVWVDIIEDYLFRTLSIIFFRVLYKILCKYG